MVRGAETGTEMAFLKPSGHNLRVAKTMEKTWKPPETLNKEAVVTSPKQLCVSQGQEHHDGCDSRSPRLIRK